MNIQDNELSVIVPKVKWHQMENELSEAEKLIQDLLEKGDNIVVVKVSEARGIINHHNWETIYYSDFDIKGGGEIIQDVIETQKRDYKELLKSVEYSRHTPCTESRESSITESELWGHIKTLEDNLLAKDKSIKRIGWFFALGWVLIALWTIFKACSV